MKKTPISKALMIVAGIFAAVIILFSQSLYHQAELTQKKNAEHNKANSEKVAIGAPSDAVTSSSMVKLHEATTPTVQSFFTKEEKKSTLKVDAKVFIKYFKVLFRASIAPNAP